MAGKIFMRNLRLTQQAIDELEEASVKDIMDHTGLVKNEVLVATKKLRDDDLVQFEYRGANNKLYFFPK